MALFFASQFRFTFQYPYVPKPKFSLTLFSAQCPPPFSADYHSTLLYCQIFPFPLLGVIASLLYAILLPSPPMFLFPTVLTLLYSLFNTALPRLSHSDFAAPLPPCILIYLDLHESCCIISSLLDSTNYLG